MTQITRTALVVALVCAVMPFVNVSCGEQGMTFSLWQFGTSAFRYSDIGYLFPNKVASMLIFTRILAWLSILLPGIALILTFNRNRATKNSDNALIPLIFTMVTLAFSFGLYFYCGYLLHSYVKGAVIAFDVGGIAFIAALSVAVLCLLVRKVKSRMKLAAILIFITIPLTIIFGSLLLENRKYYFISLLVIFETLLPFFLIFENRKPEARELVVIAVVAAIAVVGRAVFFMIPDFKPVTAIVIIAGACLGAEAGFLTGAMTAFVSNFFFGQGPWTPWQMFSFGIIGFLTGYLFRKGILKKEKKVTLCIYGVFVTICIFGLLMDTYTVFTMDFVSSFTEVLAIYISGFPVNCVHAFATFVFLFVLAKPMMEKIERVRKKYGMMEPGEEHHN